VDRAARAHRRAARGRELGHQRAVAVEHARDVRQEEERAGAEGVRERARRQVGVHVVEAVARARLSRRERRHGREDRQAAVGEQRLDETRIGARDASDVAKVRRAHLARRREGRSVGAAQAHRARAFLLEGGDELLVHEAREHHQHDLGHGGVRDAQAVLVALRERQAPPQRADLVAAAVHEDDLEARAPRQDDGPS
jgi:hypothetical protein